MPSIIYIITIEEIFLETLLELVFVPYCIYVNAFDTTNLSSLSSTSLYIYFLRNKSFLFSPFFLIDFRHPISAANLYKNLGKFAVINIF